MDSVSKVWQRIQAIEQRFKVTAAPNEVSFSNVLERAQRVQTGEPVGKLENSGEVAQMVQTAAQRYGVDPKLALAVAQTESSLSPNVVSSAGAVGVMQLMPDTAASLGVQNPYDPRQNIDGGVRYLKQMLNSFNGDVKKAVAAYNAGAGAVQKYNGIPPYSETQNYVAKVMELCR